MEEIKSKLKCYETRKSSGDDFLKDEMGFLVEAKLVTPHEKAGERIVYHLKSHDSFSGGDFPTEPGKCSWTLVYHTIRNITRINTTKVQTEYDTKTIYLGYVEDIDQLVKELIEYYKIGRVLVKRNVWGAVTDAYIRHLYYTQAKRILSFENRAKFGVSTEPSMCPVESQDPNLINDRVDFGDYCLEAWRSKGGRRKYTCITFSNKTHKWIGKVCRQATV